MTLLMLHVTLSLIKLTHLVIPVTEWENIFHKTQKLFYLTHHSGVPTACISGFYFHAHTSSFEILKCCDTFGFGWSLTLAVKSWKQVMSYHGQIWRSLTTCEALIENGHKHLSNGSREASVMSGITHSASKALLKPLWGWHKPADYDLVAQGGLKAYAALAASKYQHLCYHSYSLTFTSWKQNAFS